MPAAYSKRHGCLVIGYGLARVPSFWKLVITPWVT